jgi:putative addiction module component (TIGR02574 family)
MTTPLDALEAEVLNLPALQRSHLLDRLINSLETDPEIQNAWAAEAERRDDELAQGKATALSGPSVLARLRGLP